MEPARAALAAIVRLWSPCRNARALFGRPRETRDASLDGLRIFAVLWVISCHLVSYAYMLPNALAAATEMRTDPAYRVFYNGINGVDIFFVLSGYLIFTLLYDDFERGRTLSVVGKFLARRVLRLLPSYALALGIFYYLTSTSGTPVGNEQAQLCYYNWWRNLPLFISNLSPDQCMGWTWSISIEMQFYVVSPWIVLLARKLKTPWAVRALLGGLSLVSMALFIGLTLYFFGSADDGEAYLRWVYHMPHTRLFAYTLGMWAAWEVRLARLAPPRPLSAPFAPWYIARFVATAVTLVTAFWFHCQRTAPFELAASDLAQLALGHPLFSCGMAYIVYDLQLPTNYPGNVWGAKILGNRVTYTVAQWTYTIYLYHLTIIFVLYGVVFQKMAGFVFTPSWMVVSFMLGVFVISAVIALLVYFTFEKPFNNIGTDYCRMKKDDDAPEHQQTELALLAAELTADSGSV